MCTSSEAAARREQWGRRAARLLLPRLEPERTKHHLERVRVDHPLPVRVEQIERLPHLRALLLRWLTSFGEADAPRPPPVVPVAAAATKTAEEEATAALGLTSVVPASSS